eukprot:9332758-Alexandrium_andersonii.AAC.1
MGSLTTGTGGCQLEVKERITPQASPYGMRQRKVLPNPAIQAQVRVSLTDALLDTRLLKSARAWIGLTRAQQASLMPQQARVLR